MKERSPSWQFAVLRYVPDVAAERFLNLAVVMLSESDAPFVRVQCLADWTRVTRFDENADIELLKEIVSELKRRLSGDQRQAAIEMMQQASGSLQFTPFEPCRNSGELELRRLASVYLVA